jgi:type I restriction enzyme, R subunit
LFEGEKKKENAIDLINQMDGALGDQWLRTFKDNEKTIPTILTTTTKGEMG